MSALDLQSYYPGLLIRQYNGKAKAAAHIAAMVAPLHLPQTTVQAVTFPAAPASGTFTLSWDGHTTASLAWNATAAAVQTALQALPGLSSATVTAITNGYSVTFTGVTPPADYLTYAGTVDSTSGPMTPTITETDLTLPLAVREAFNLVLGTTTAVGAQLDTLAKYAGVTRQGLSDADFLTLIRLAIIQNTSNSSLASIQSFIQQFFPGTIRVFDYRNMRMSYLVSTALGSQALVQSFVSQGLLPKPACVSIGSVIYSSNITSFFGFRTYYGPAVNAQPYNTYAAYDQTHKWLSYADAVST